MTSRQKAAAQGQRRLDAARARHQHQASIAIEAKQGQRPVFPETAEVRALIAFMEATGGIEGPPIVPVRCRSCGSVFTALALGHDDVLPVDPAHEGTRFVRDKTDAGTPGPGPYRVQLRCPCGQKSPSVRNVKLARQFMYALAGNRAILWPLP